MTEESGFLVNDVRLSIQNQKMVSNFGLSQFLEKYGTEGRNKVAAVYQILDVD